ncbi:MAG: hypothetical protein Q8K83_07430 [Methylotenera sp.]|nr:hypothetical protein [Methylotenera sp.]
MTIMQKSWISRLICSWMLHFIVPLFCLSYALHVKAEPHQANVYLFWANGCPHCAKEIDFLKRLKQEQPAIQVHLFEVGEKDSRSLFLDVLTTLRITEPSVPLTIVGNHVWMGYVTDEISGAQIRERVNTCMAVTCPDVVAGLLAARPLPSDSGIAIVRAEAPEKIELPLLGKVTLRDLSLPVLTITLGALDGFNPCAMWTLIFLIGLLIGMKDSLRMWVLGSAFILGSAAVYFVIMAAWLNLLLFFGALLIVRIIIALVALGGGFYYLREFFFNKDGVCPVTAPEGRQRVFNRLRQFAQQRSFLLALLGILALAFLVNLVELLCSAGIPAVYTQILAMHELPTWQYYSYLLLYILAFMIDDLLVFVVAMLTLRVSGLTARYSRYSHLIGGVLLLAIGTLMLLRPDLLMFG